MVEATLGNLPLVHGAVITGLGLGDAVMEVGNGVLHVGMKGDALLDHEEVFGPLHHPFDVGSVILRTVTGPLLADGAVVDADLVPHLAAEKLVDRHIGRLAGNVPKRVLDGRDGGAIGLETAALADFEHAALDIGGVLADEGFLEMEHEGFEVGLGELHLAQAIKAFIGDDADDGVAADDGAAQVGDFHGFLLMQLRCTVMSPSGQARGWRAVGGNQLQVRSQEYSSSQWSVGSQMPVACS